MQSRLLGSSYALHASCTRHSNFLLHYHHALALVRPCTRALCTTCVPEALALLICTLLVALHRLSAYISEAVMHFLSCYFIVAFRLDSLLLRIYVVQYLLRLSSFAPVVQRVKVFCTPRMFEPVP